MRAMCAARAPRFTVGLSVVLLGASPIFAAVPARASPPDERAVPLSADEPASPAQPAAAPAPPRPRKKKRRPRAPAPPPPASEPPASAPAAETPAPPATAPTPVTADVEPSQPPRPQGDTPAVAPAPAAQGGASAATDRDARPVEAQPVAPAPASSSPALKIGGGAMLWYYQPIDLEGVGDNIEVYDARLSLEADYEKLGLYLEPHFRDSRLRSYYDGPVWLQQAYAFLDLDTAVVKVGKVYSRFGLFWDNSFYGNIPAYDGLKLSPEYGASLEGTLGRELGVRYWAQLFPVDGRTNVSLTGRDTISVPGAHRKNEAVVRLEPFAALADNAQLAVGLSAEYFRADFATDPQDVWRLGVDAKLTVGGLGMWGELARQEGRSVTDFPFAAIPASATTAAVPGRASAHNDYLLVGVEYTLWKLTARYNMSLANYNDVSLLEWLVVPGLGYAVQEHVTILAEYALWQRYTAGTASLFDRSVNLSVSAWF